MPEWSKVLKEIAESLAAAAREANATQRSGRPLGEFGDETQQSRQPLRKFADVKPPASTCLFWDCTQTIRPDHIFCYDHFQAFKEGSIDECPGCGRAKDIMYDLCLDCYKKSSSSPRKGQSYVQTERSRWYRPEYSPSWESRDATADRFFVYILKLADGGFYAGQTRELRERLSEHRDGKAQGTKDKKPKLVWFGILRSREEATSMEAELKKLVDSNPREIRRMIISFQDLVQELDYT